MSMMSEGARSFIDVFKPRRGKYAIWVETEVPDEFGRKWRWRKGKLTDELVEECQLGRELIAFLCLSSTDYFGIDIDDHNTGGWLGSAPTNALLEKYAEVVRKIGKEPCVMFRSPHGAHAFWFFDKVLPVLVIQEIIEARVGKVGEFLPRYQSGIRMPKLFDCIDEGFGMKTITSFIQIGRYPYKEIFGEDAEPAEIKKRLRAHSLSVPTKRAGTATKRIELEERACGRFVNHQSNPTYCRLVGVYFAEGLSEEAATLRVLAFANQSVGYFGDLRNRGAAETRVRESYANMTRSTDFGAQEERLLRDPAMKSFIEKITKKLGVEHNTRKRRRIETFVAKLKAWVDYITRIGQDYELRAYWAHIYPGFAKYFKMGYMPIPSSL